jgi:hypothetical protein
MIVKLEIYTKVKNDWNSIISKFLNEVVDFKIENVNWRKTKNFRADPQMIYDLSLEKEINTFESCDIEGLSIRKLNKTVSIFIRLADESKAEEYIKFFIKDIICCLIYHLDFVLNENETVPFNFHQIGKKYDKKKVINPNDELIFQRLDISQNVGRTFFLKEFEIGLVAAWKLFFNKDFFLQVFSQKVLIELENYFVVQYLSPRVFSVQLFDELGKSDTEESRYKMGLFLKITALRDIEVAQG